MARRYARKSRSRRTYSSPRRSRGRVRNRGRSFSARGRRSTGRRSGGRTVRIVIEQPSAPSLGRVIPGMLGGTMVNSGGVAKTSKF